MAVGCWRTPVRSRKRLRSARIARDLRTMHTASPAPLPRCPSTGKAQYSSERTAKEGLRTLHHIGKSGTGRLHAYRCPDCFRWHVGHVGES